MRRGCLAVLHCLLLVPGRAGAQLERHPEEGGRTVSLGQPPRLHWQVGVTGGALLRTRQGTAQAFVGVTRPLFNPVAGLASLGAETYFGTREGLGGVDTGLRALFRVPYIGLGAGVDYNLRDARLEPLVTMFGPVRRGGILAAGGLLRIDVFPGRRHGLALGAALPVGDRFTGRGRPLRDYVQVGADFEPRVQYALPEPELEAVLDSIRVSAEWLRRLVAPFLDQDARTGSLALARTESYVRELQQRLAVRDANDEARHFHAQLERAFTVAAADRAAGAELARHARAILLEEVLLPYNRLLGRKKRQDTLEDLATAARGRFARTVTAGSLVPADRADRVLFTFQRLTELVNDVRRAAAAEWNDARLVWLPLQYGLLPADYDEQQELDALVARATGEAFTGQNAIRYVANLQFHWELLRSIRATEDYHVLWVHDFPAVTPAGQLDWAAFAQLVDGYLDALARNVERYDTTGKLPTYFILLDEFYYEARRSRILMNVLENPLGASARLPRNVSGDVAPLQRVLERLRAAVQNSRVLQAEARQYGEHWLHNRIKVHVNITHRADPSFWGGALVGTIFGYPDNVMRDHRKIAFRDVTAADPARGEAILTGMGVGQQYLGPEWEDRSLIAAGPVLLGLRRAAREVLLYQGLEESEIPFELRDDALPPFAAAGTPAGPGPRRAPAPPEEGVTPALLLVNGTGYLPKPMNVAKAVLYSLLGAGAVIKIPDSLWNSSFFGSLLVGASLRGGTVSITAPAVANAPSDGFPQMARAHELLTRLLLVRTHLAAALGAAAGDLRVGMYAIEPDREGFASRMAEWARRMAATAPSRAFGPAHGSLLPVVRAAATRPAAAAIEPRTDATRLHQKVQFLATGELWDAIAGSPAWPEFMASYLEYREATYAVREGGESELAHSFQHELMELAARIHEPATGRSGAACYALVGSQNMDYRGMFMDGEVGVLFTGPAALVPLLDLLFLEGTVTWVEDQATLDRLLPPPSELKRRIARLIKDAM